MTLERKVVIVTGGASGIGRASAIELALKGANVVVVDLDTAGARDVVAEIATHGHIATVAGLDIGDSDAVSAMVQSVHRNHGHLDVLVHAAGICRPKSLLEMTDHDWQETLRTNLDGTFFVTRDVGRIMAHQRTGTMILVTSDRGVHGSIDYGHYAASKGGMLALTKSLALALGKSGVTVNAINPGLTDTPLARAAVSDWDKKLQWDVLGGCSRPEEIAEIVSFLADGAGRFMTGQILGTRMRYGH